MVNAVTIPKVECLTPWLDVVHLDSVVMIRSLPGSLHPIVQIRLCTRNHSERVL
jgi:hypothetical protein